MFSFTYYYTILCTYYYYVLYYYNVLLDQLIRIGARITWQLRTTFFQLPSIMNKLHIKIKSVIMSSLIKDEFEVPDNIMEEYHVYYGENYVGRFWISNYYEDLFECSHPLTMSELNFIQQEIRARSFNRNV